MKQEPQSPLDIKEFAEALRRLSAAEPGRS